MEPRDEAVYPGYPWLSAYPLLWRRSMALVCTEARGGAAIVDVLEYDDGVCTSDEEVPPPNDDSDAEDPCDARGGGMPGRVGGEGWCS